MERNREEPKTFFITTYGCQMNELDSEIMQGALEKRGMQRAETEEDADLLLFNTCSIRDLSERKFMGKVGRMKHSKKASKIIGVAGCMAMAKREKLFEKLPHIDFIVGTNNIGELDSILNEVLETNQKVIKTDQTFEENLDYLVAKRKNPVHAYISIIRGCNKHCTYCVVPYTRGKEVSRSPQSIIEECKILASQGYKEVTLLGQNVNSYGKDTPAFHTLFHDLLALIDGVDGIERIRFMTSHPCDITKELMLAVRDLPTVCEFVHFPMQAGSSRILRKMHRVYAIEEYVEKVHLFREIVPGVALGTDIIVGFPTETEEEFQMTSDRFEELQFEVAFIFAYSRRKGTPAFRFKDDIPESIKQERQQKLLKLYLDLTAQNREKILGKEVEVLVEKRSRDQKYLKGRTRCWKNVLFEAEDHLIGTLQKVKVHGFAHQTLLGKIKKAPSLQLVS